jgi:hypothetical protein
MEARSLRVDPVLAALTRRSARLPVVGKLQVAIQNLPIDLRLRDLSYSSFAIVASRPFWRGMTHRFTFATQSGESITLVAKSVHCQQVAEDAVSFLSGWEFMRGSADRTEAAIGKLVDTLTLSTKTSRLD